MKLAEAEKHIGSDPFAASMRVHPMSTAAVRKTIETFVDCF
jgi:hypothetical protein